MQKDSKFVCKWRQKEKPLYLEIPLMTLLYWPQTCGTGTKALGEERDDTGGGGERGRAESVKVQSKQSHKSSSWIQSGREVWVERGPAVRGQEALLLHQQGALRSHHPSEAELKKNLEDSSLWMGRGALLFVITCSHFSKSRIYIIRVWRQILDKLRCFFF